MILHRGLIGLNTTLDPDAMTRCGSTVTVSSDVPFHRSYVIGGVIRPIDVEDPPTPTSFAPGDVPSTSLDGCGVLSHFGRSIWNCFAFLVLILVLVLRPTGLLGEKVSDRA